MKSQMDSFNNFFVISCKISAINRLLLLYIDIYFLWRTTTRPQRVAPVYQSGRGASCVTFSRQKLSTNRQEVLVMKTRAKDAWGDKLTFDIHLRVGEWTRFLSPSHCLQRVYLEVNIINIQLFSECIKSCKYTAPLFILWFPFSSQYMDYLDVRPQLWPCFAPSSWKLF